jgi:WD40 repeat protein
MRTKAQIHVLSGHTATVADVKCQESDPQVITGSMDSTVRLWDLAAGKTMTTLTHHKKSVRSLAIHPTEYSFASGSAGGNNIKKWKCPEGAFVFNFGGHNAIINTLSVNAEGVFFSGGDNGTLTFWDYGTGVPFQNLDDIPQPGSLEAEAGVFCSTFDLTGTRLITGGADKTIKVLCMLFCSWGWLLIFILSLCFLDLCGAVAVESCSVYLLFSLSTFECICNLPLLSRPVRKICIAEISYRVFHAAFFQSFSSTSSKF